MCPRFFNLAFMKSSDVLDRLAKRAPHTFIATRRTAPELLLADSQRFQLDLIKPRRVLEQRLITTHTHIINDRSDNPH
jgi:hypothetical protein